VGSWTSFEPYFESLLVLDGGDAIPLALAMLALFRSPYILGISMRATNLMVMQSLVAR
jgi:hypothetical protein